MNTLRLSKFLDKNRSQKLQVKLKNGTLYLNNTQRKIGKQYFADQGIDDYCYNFYAIGTNEEIKEFFELLRESDDVKEYNFGGSPFHWASYIEFIDFLICSPDALNGDREWFHDCYGNELGVKEIYIPVEEIGVPEEEFWDD